MQIECSGNSERVGGRSLSDVLSSTASESIGINALTSYISQLKVRFSLSEHSHSQVWQIIFYIHTLSFSLSCAAPIYTCIDVHRVHSFQSIRIFPNLPLPKHRLVQRRSAQFIQPENHLRGCGAQFTLFTLDIVNRRIHETAL